MWTGAYEPCSQKFTIDRNHLRHDTSVQSMGRPQNNEALGSRLRVQVPFSAGNYSVSLELVLENWLEVAWKHTWKSSLYEATGVGLFGHILWVMEMYPVILQDGMGVL